MEIFKISGKNTTAGVSQRQATKPIALPATGKDYLPSSPIPGNSACVIATLAACHSRSSRSSTSCRLVQPCNRASSSSCTKQRGETHMSSRLLQGLWYFCRGVFTGLLPGCRCAASNRSGVCGSLGSFICCSCL